MTVVSETDVASSWIDGEPVRTGGALHSVIDPATGSSVAQMALAAPGDVDRAAGRFPEPSAAAPTIR